MPIGENNIQLAGGIFHELTGVVSDNISLADCEMEVYERINRNNPNHPDKAEPHSMFEWANYDQNHPGIVNTFYGRDHAESCGEFNPTTIHHQPYRVPLPISKIADFGYSIYKDFELTTVAPRGWYKCNFENKTYLWDGVSAWDLNVTEDCN